jgi:hypothetical protein
MMDTVLGLLMLLVPVWPLVAIISAVIFYTRHLNRVGPERRVPVVLYVLAVLVCAGAAGFLGMIWGAEWACSMPKAGNLCGLVGVLVVGPISGALATFLVGLALSLRRAAAPA